MIGTLLFAASTLGLTAIPLQFSHGLPNDQKYFPIAVWLQDPSNATRYKQAGFNLYVGLWQGPTEDQLKILAKAGMPVICEQNSVGLSHMEDPIIVGWMHGDEPDNAQEVKDSVTGKAGYGPCIPPLKILEEYQTFHRADPTRPVMLNLGQGVANDEWIGRGTGSSLKDYETYVKGGDIVSFDIYPIAGLPKREPENYLWLVSKGLDRLAGWMGNTGSRWNCMECTRISGDRKATPAQVRSEVWMSLIHGSRGLIYFVHQFQPKFDEHALLDDPEMLSAVTAINGQIQSLAPFLNAPTDASAATVQSAAVNVPIDLMAKRMGGRLTLFTVGMRNQQTTGEFSVRGLPSHAKALVLGESRTIDVIDGHFKDRFEPYQPHIYQISR